MDVTARPHRAGARLAVLGALAVLSALSVLTPAARAADPALCTVVEHSGSASNLYTEYVATASSPDGSRLYALGSSYVLEPEATLNTVDASTGEPITQLELPLQPTQMVVDPSSGRIFVTGFTGGAIPTGVLWVVDPSGAGVIARVEYALGLDGLVADPAGGTVYAYRWSGSGAADLVAIGPDGTVTRSRPLPRTPAGGLAYDPASQDLIVSYNGGGADIQRFAAATFAPGATGPVAATGREATRLRVASSLGRLYALRGLRYLQIIDLGTLAVIAERDLGFGARDIAVDPADGVVYASAAPEASERVNFLATFDALSGAPLHSDRWGIQPRGFSLHPGGGVAVATRSEVSLVDQGDCAPADADPPSVVVSAPAEGAELPFNSAQYLVATCSDAGSGLAGLPLSDPRYASRCRTEANGESTGTQASIDTSAPGPKSVTVSARDGAGNETVVVRSYTVLAPPPDTQDPAIALATPQPAPDPTPSGNIIGPQPFTLDQVVPLEVLCLDYESGIDTCDATVDGTPIQNGDPLPTGSPGTRRVRVVARDVAGNEATAERDYRVLAGERSEPYIVGALVVSTDPGGLGATPRVPVQTDVLVTKSARGPFDVSLLAAPQPPGGLTALAGTGGLRLQFAGTRQSSAFQSTVTFRIDSSVLPADPGRVTLVRSGAAVEACAATDPPAPDPCVEARRTLPDGDLAVDVRLLHGDSVGLDEFGATRELFDAVWSFALRAPDLTDPQITLASPAENTVVPIAGVLALDVSCSDEPGGSGLASCVSTVDGAVVGTGDLLPTTTPGPHQVHVVARDAAGNEMILDRSYVVPAGSISVTGVTGPAVVATGDASPQIPLQTEIAIPAGVSGSVSVLPTGAAAPPAGYAIIAGAPDLTISAPDASAASPLRLTFTIDASLLAGPPAIAPATVVPTRDGVPVADCTTPDTATPDPCVESRTTDAEGDLHIVVRTSHASAWALVRRLAPPVGTSIADASVVEGDTGTTALRFMLTRTGSTAQAATLRWDTADGTAVAGLDYTAQVSRTARFAAGSATTTVSVPVVGDRLDEPDETLLVRLGNPSGTAIIDGEALGTIVDEDPPTLSIDDATRLEGDSRTRDLTFAVRLSKKWNRAVTVDWVVQDITTTAGSDYVNGAGALSGRVTIPAGDRTATITVSVKGDRTREGVSERPGGPRYERLRVVLSRPTQAIVADGEAIGRIQDDD